MEETFLQTVRTLADSIVEGVLLLDPKGDLVMANRTAFQFFHAERVEELRVLRDRAARFEVVDAARRPVPERDFPAYRAIRGERFRNLEQIFNERATGRESTLLFSGAPIFDVRGHVNYALVLFADITERAQRGRTLEHELGAVEERFRLLLDQLTEQVMTRTLDGTVTHVNRSLAEFLGKSAVEIVGHPVIEVFSEPNVTEEVTRGLRLGQIVSRRLQLLDATGRARDLDFTWQIVPRSEGDPEVLAVARDVTAFVDRERALSAENELMTALVRVVRRIFSGLDPRVLVENVVRGAHELFGGSAVLYAALPDGTFVAVDDVSWPPSPAAGVDDELVANAAASGEVWCDDPSHRALLPVAGPDGATRWVLDIHLSDDGSLPHDEERFAAELLARNFSVAARNVALYAELERQRASVIELNQMKSDLIAMLAHDFKGPLTTIAGFAQLLLDDDIEDPRERRASLEAVLNAAMRLASLASDTLMLSRLEENEPVLHAAPFDLAAMVEEVVRSYAAEREVTVEAELAPAVVTGDRERLRQVFENLISNAIKYSPDGRPVNVLVRRDGDEVAVDVRDRGIGIPADEIPGLFGRFARASNARKLGITGSGFGLYLAKQFVEKSGGRIGVFSIEGSGSTFSVYLPLAEGGAPAAACLPKRVLVADDDADIRSFMAHALRGAGYAVRAVADGVQALERLRVERFDAAVLDMDMPGLTGEEVRKHLRAEGASAVGLVLTSGIAQAPPPGWDAFVAKPFLVKDLVAAVERALR